MDDVRCCWPIYPPKKNIPRTWLRCENLVVISGVDCTYGLSPFKDNDEARARENVSSSQSKPLHLVRVAQFRRAYLFQSQLKSGGHVRDGSLRLEQIYFVPPAKIGNVLIETERT